MIQLSFLPQKTVAQYVYAAWLYFYRGGNRYNYYPSNMIVLKQTADYLDLPEELIERIVRVQSKWDARNTLRKAGTKG